MSGYNLFSQLMSYFFRYSTCFNVFIPRPVTTSFDRFFAVPVRGSCILKLSGTGPVHGPSKKGNRTETGPDFKALVAQFCIHTLSRQLQIDLQSIINRIRVFQSTVDACCDFTSQCIIVRINHSSCIYNLFYSPKFSQRSTVVG